MFPRRTIFTAALLALASLFAASAAQAQGQATGVVSMAEPLPNCTSPTATLMQSMVWDVTLGQMMVCSGGTYVPAGWLVIAKTTSSVGLTISAASGQTADLLDFKVNGSLLSAVDASGQFTGQAATAASLAAVPVQCSGSDFAIGIAANGDCNGAQPYLKNLADVTISSQAVGDTLCASSTTQWANCVPGVPFDAQTGTSYTILTGDRGKLLTTNNGSAIAVTVPQAGSTGFANNFNLAGENLNTGLATYTPTTSTVNGNASQIVPQYWAFGLYSDNTNWRMPVMPTIQAFADCNGTGKAETFTASTGLFGCNTISGSGTVTTTGSPASGNLAKFSGTTAITNGDLSGDCTTSGTLAVTCLPVVSLNTSTPVTVSTTATAAFYNNQNATAGTAVTYNLPTAAAGKQFCFTNSYNGSAADTGVLTLQTSASGQYIIFNDGTLSTSGGYVTSGGAAADAACAVGVDSTHWQLYVERGTWTKH